LNRLAGFAPTRYREVVLTVSKQDFACSSSTHPLPQVVLTVSKQDAALPQQSDVRLGYSQNHLAVAGGYAVGSTPTTLRTYPAKRY